MFVLLLILTVALHGYLALRLLPALPVAMAWLLGAWLVLSAVMTPAPFVARAWLGAPLPDWGSWVAYVMMGVFSLLLVLVLLRDVLLLSAAALGYLLPNGLNLTSANHASAWLVLALAAGMTVAGMVNARQLAQVGRVDVPIAGLPAALQGFTIVQISDIHVGPTIKRDYLQAIVDAVNALHPDMVAITGDLVDGSVQRLAPHVAPLAQLKAVHGSYFVTGNHEYYSGAEAWVAELRRLGITVLLNEHVIISHQQGRLLVAGVTDYSGQRHGSQHVSDPAAALAGAPTDVAVKLLLAHQPRSAAQAEQAGFDVQLSGHTHGGQYWPWNLFVPLQQPFVAGLHRLGNLLVYTSRGTGYWGPPIRFGAPSEITCLRLVAG